MRNWAVLALFWVSFLGLANADSGPANTGEDLRYFHIEASAAPLETVRIFVFGENHTFPSDAAAAAQLIKRFSRPRDILLLEGSGIGPSLANEATRPALRRAAQGLMVGGWDNRAAVIAFKESIAESLRLGEIVNSSRLGFFDRRRLIARAEDLEALRQRLLQTRHLTMCEKIKAVARANPAARIFVVAGTYHVEAKSHPEIVPCLKETGAPYARFIPRENNPHRQRVISDEEYRSRLANGQ